MTTASQVQTADPLPRVPDISDDETFGQLAHKLGCYMIEAVDSPLVWDDLRSSKHVKKLQPLIDKLSHQVRHLAVVAALLALKGHFRAIENDDDSGINESRGLACELVAWQFVLALSERDALDYLLFELRRPRRHHADRDADADADADPGSDSDSSSSSSSSSSSDDEEYRAGSATERTGLLTEHHHANGNGNGSDEHGRQRGAGAGAGAGAEDGFAAPYWKLNALEIASVAGAKKFLSQRAVQNIVDGIWYGDIVFWEALTVHAVKKPRYYNKKLGDPWSRLRVPRYIKSFEIFFFLCFLALFYIVSIQRQLHALTISEVLFYLFVAGFSLNEWHNFAESGAYFYLTDIWSLWDLAIILVGLVFFILRVIGLSMEEDKTRLLDTAFTILALHSLFLTPRLFSLLSLSPYYGSLLPCLKEMGKQFVRFLGFILIIYLGFFSTFVLLARGHFSLSTMSITILKVFFGAGVVGFDVAPQISPYLGLPVMVVFVCLTNQLLITCLMAHISNSLRQVLDSAREEYLYVYSVYVLESSTSDKLTQFYTPFNLIPALFLRPLLLAVKHRTAERIRIILLKATHAPFVALIWLYEKWAGYMAARDEAQSSSLSFWNLAGLSGAAKPTAGREQSLQPSARRPTTKISSLLRRAPAKAPPALLHASLKPKRDSDQPARPASTWQGRTALSSGPAHDGTGAVPKAKTVAVPEPQPQPQPQLQPAGTAPIPVAGAAVAAAAAAGAESETIRLLKELAAQVEELRSSFVASQQPADI